MKKIFFSLVTLLLHIDQSFASRIETGITPIHTLIPEDKAKSMGLVEILSFIESFLLTVVLPLVIIGTALFIAYELFTAEGDEEKLKKAWKSVTYGSIGVISVALAYAVVSLTSRLSF